MEGCSGSHVRFLSITHHSRPLHQPKPQPPSLPKKRGRKPTHSLTPLTQTALDIPSPSDPRTWRFQLFMNWRLSPSSPPVSDPSNVLPELKAWAPKLVDPWKSAIEWLPDDTVIEMQKIQYWQPIARDNWGGRVTLAGDAGHAMVPCKSGLFTEFHQHLDSQGLVRSESAQQVMHANTPGTEQSAAKVSATV